MLRFLSKAALTAFLYANSIIVIRLLIFSLTFFCLNTFYTKWETLLLATDPNKLIYLLIIYSSILLIMLVWVIYSFPLFTSFAKSKKAFEIKKSINERSDEYEKIKDVRIYPTLKSNTQKTLEE